MAGTPKPQRRTFRYWLQQLHLWIGLILLLPLIMMGITGAVLVYAHDIEHLLGQGERHSPTVLAGGGAALSAGHGERAWAVPRRRAGCSSRGKSDP